MHQPCQAHCSWSCTHPPTHPHPHTHTHTHKVAKRKQGQQEAGKANTHPHTHTHTHTHTLLCIALHTHPHARTHARSKEVAEQKTKSLNSWRRKKNRYSESIVLHKHTRAAGISQECDLAVMLRQIMHLPNTQHTHYTLPLFGNCIFYMGGGGLSPACLSPIPFICMRDFVRMQSICGNITSLHHFQNQSNQKTKYCVNCKLKPLCCMWCPFLSEVPAEHTPGPQTCENLLGKYQLGVRWSFAVLVLIA